MAKTALTPGNRPEDKGEIETGFLGERIHQVTYLVIGEQVSNLAGTFSLYFHRVGENEEMGYLGGKESEKLK